MDFNKLISEWQEFKSELLQFMEEYDFIISPVSAFPAREHGFSYDKDIIPSFSYTMFYNLNGWPSISVRANRTENGLPIGVQIASAPWKENISLSLASIVEKEFGGWEKPKINVDN